MNKAFSSAVILFSTAFVLLGGSTIAAEIDQGSSNYLVAQADMGNKDLRDRKLDSKDVRDDKRSDNSHPGPKNFMGKTGLTECPGEFAFCGSSTCKPTGRKIKVKEDGGKTTREYEEAVCKCPVITKEIAVQNGVTLHGLAAVNEGNMNGSCARPSPDKIWSYYAADVILYPQESMTPPFTTAQANAQVCPAGSGTGVNCWNYLCTVDAKKTNGAKTATCKCPIGEGYIGHPTTASEGFVTTAGGYYATPSSACAMYPVSGPVPAGM